MPIDEIVRRQSFIVDSPTLEVSFSKVFEHGRPRAMRISELSYNCQIAAGSMTIVVGSYAKHYDPYLRKCTRFIPLVNVVGVRVWSDSTGIDSEIDEFQPDNAQIRVYIDNALQPTMVNATTPLYLTVDFIY